MRRFRFISRLIVVLIVIAILALAIWQVRAWYRYGDAIAFCPGPDLYGYWCERADVAYVDATTDSQLYVDDGTTTIPLPFEFTFYGRTYTEIEASSNGNLQFGGDNATFRNTCLDEATEMGDVIAPYWDDLNLLRTGFLEYDVVGTPPNRIFVIEWDGVPRFANPDDLLTFEVQLFENNHDIVFLYENVATLSSPNGQSATIGIKSEQQGLALVYSCNQVSVFNNGGIHIFHPDEPNPELVASAPRSLKSGPHPLAKGEIVTLIEQLNAQGENVLPHLRRAWRQQNPARQTEWAWADITGDGRDEFVLLWHARQAYPELNQLVILTRTPTGELSLSAVTPLIGRADPLGVRSLHSLVDKTGDGIADVVVSDGGNNRYVYAWRNDTLERMR